VWLKILSVFGAGMIGLWEGIPAGLALRLPPLVIGVTSAAGSTTATLLVLLLGERLRTRLLRGRNSDEPRRERMIDRIWRRYGIIGLGLASPCLTGAPIGVALGLLLRAPAGKLLLWSLIGIAAWAVILTTLGALSTEGVLRLLH
jgi:hypothetical protein